MSNNANNPGLTVSDLLGNTATSPDDHSSLGLAITRTIANSGQWQYSLDNGETWQTIQTVSDAKALLLRSNDKIRFAPNGQGGSASLRYHAWDQTADEESEHTAGHYVDISNNGGATPFSEMSASASVTINEPKNLPPIVTRDFTHDDAFNNVAAGQNFSFHIPRDAFQDPDSSQPLTLSVSNLPPGISFNPETDTLSGVPTSSGGFTITITARDAEGEAVNVNIPLSISPAIQNNNAAPPSNEPTNTTPPTSEGGNDAQNSRSENANNAPYSVLGAGGQTTNPLSPSSPSSSPSSSPYGASNPSSGLLGGTIGNYASSPSPISADPNARGGDAAQTGRAPPAPPASLQINAADVLAFVSSSEFSNRERQQALQTMSSASLIRNLAATGDRTLSTVASMLSDMSNGANVSYNTVKSVLQSGGYSQDAINSYLAIYQKVQNEQKLQIVSGALSELSAGRQPPSLFNLPITNAAPSLNVASAIRSGDSILISGAVSNQTPFVEVRINGRWVYADDQGVFQARIPASAAANGVTIQMRDESGLSITRTVPANSIQNVENQNSDQNDDVRPPVSEPRRVAVMFGNQAYQDTRISSLDTPLQDVSALTNALQNKLGYDVVSLPNPTRAQIAANLQNLIQTIGPNDQVIIYYAGHGVVNPTTGTGYWLPTDATVDSTENWISNQDVARVLNRLQARQIMLISDSCYSGAFITGKADGGGVTDPNELAEMRSVIAISAGGLEPVADGEDHSPFARALISQINSVGEGQAAFGRDVFQGVQKGVEQESPQSPNYGSVALSGQDPGADFVFDARVKPAKPASSGQQGELHLDDNGDGDNGDGDFTPSQPRSVPTRHHASVDPDDVIRADDHHWSASNSRPTTEPNGVQLAAARHTIRSEPIHNKQILRKSA
ncbi:hypothetical protein CCP2SC5_730002 [Azospirillaceae bacterium]